MALRKCNCPIYCKYCARHRSKDSTGHYCKTRNCQWQHGYPNCYYVLPVKESVYVAKR